ncbi:hypothetical protein PLICRDRAFT_239783 [Plicaturopsis crispa FD-325 SS-3]|nr:hypothetical protein PLICRDRAFT_239783 [Plicaturopsis crispa FD-325 SS-3]
MIAHNSTKPNSTARASDPVDFHPFCCAIFSSSQFLSLGVAMPMRTLDPYDSACTQSRAVDGLTCIHVTLPTPSAFSCATIVSTFCLTVTFSTLGRTGRRTAYAAIHVILD